MGVLEYCFVTFVVLLRWMAVKWCYHVSKKLQEKNKQHTSRTSAITPKVFHSSLVNNNACSPDVLKPQSSMAYKKIYVSHKNDGISSCEEVKPPGVAQPDDSWHVYNSTVYRHPWPLSRTATYLPSSFLWSTCPLCTFKTFSAVGVLIQPYLLYSVANAGLRVVLVIN